jgi:sugar lactone lactonase YvrE
LGPDGKLYLTVMASALPGNQHDGFVYRLRLSERPSAADLETFHVFRSHAGQHFPGPMDIEFGKSGRVYVTLGYGYQLAVLSRDGKEIRRISSPQFATPTGLAFFGRSLLVSNADFAPEERDKWRILRVWVNDRQGAAAVRPSVGSPP